MPKLLAMVFLAAALILPQTARTAEMTISAAASLTNAFAEMVKAFEKTHPGLIIHTNYAASNPLLRQIVEGAPVDVFASADQQTMDKAAEAKVVNLATRKNFAQNDLVLIVPKGSPMPSSLADLEKMKTIAIGNPDSVPAGRYAKDALTKTGLWNRVQDKLVFGASVRQTLDYVARGEVDAGFVYGTDARQFAEKVDIAVIVDGHDPVSYPIAVSVTGNNPKAGQEFLDFVLSSAGQAILAKYGFTKP